MAGLHIAYNRLDSFRDSLLLTLWMCLLFALLLAASFGFGGALLLLLFRPWKKPAEMKEGRVFAVIVFMFAFVFLLLLTTFQLPLANVPFVKSHGQMVFFVAVQGVGLLLASLLLAAAALRLVYPKAGTSSALPRRRVRAVVAFGLSVVAVSALSRCYVSEPAVARARAGLSEPAAHRKVLLVGIDGADWKVLNRMLAAGELPTFRRLVETGVHGPLRTLQNANSAVIWNTIYSGKGRHKHGILDFYYFTFPGVNSPVYAIHRSSFREIAMILDRLGLPPAMKAVDRTVCGAKPVWKILSEHGYSVGRVGVRMTYPADRSLNGFVVTDSADGIYRFKRNQFGRAVFPADLAPAVGEVLEGVPRPSRGEDAAETLADIDWKEATLLAALEKGQPDFVHVYLLPPDGVQHYNWKTIEPQYYSDALKREFARDENPVFVAYRRIDRFLSAVLEAVEPGTDVVLLSDHGHGALFWGGTKKNGLHYDSGHRWGPPGVIIMNGPDIAQGAPLDSPGVEDVAPTVLALLGMPVAGDMDGAPMEEAFREGFRAPPDIPGTVDTYEGIAEPSREDRAAPIDDLEFERLKSLGYIF